MIIIIKSLIITVKKSVEITKKGEVVAIGQ